MRILSTAFDIFEIGVLFSEVLVEMPINNAVIDPLNDTVKIYMQLFKDKYPDLSNSDHAITENDIRRLLIESKKQGMILAIDKVNPLLLEIAFSEDKTDHAIELIVQQARSPKSKRSQRTNNGHGGGRRKSRTHKRTLHKHKRRTHKRAHRQTHRR